DGLLAKDARRLSSELSGRRLLGLPVQVVDDRESAPEQVGALVLNVALTSSKPGQTQGRVTLRHASLGGWTNLGSATFKADAASGTLDGSALADAVARAIASSFVTAKATSHGPGTTRVQISNRLPFTLAHVVVRTGRGDDAGSVTLTGLGVGPAR